MCSCRVDVEVCELRDRECVKPLMVINTGLCLINSLFCSENSVKSPLKVPIILITTTIIIVTPFSPSSLLLFFLLSFCLNLHVNHILFPPLVQNVLNKLRSKWLQINILLHE